MYHHKNQKVTKIFGQIEKHLLTNLKQKNDQPLYILKYFYYFCNKFVLKRIKQR